MSSLREKILGASDIRTKSVYVATWDVTVEVRTLTGAQRSEARKGAIETSRNSDGEEVQTIDEAKLSAGLVIAGTFDPETNSPLFQAADRDALMGKSAVALDEIVAELGVLSGVTVGEQKAMEKNSEATPSVAITSA